MDGTTLCSNSELTARTSDAIRRAYSAGVRVVIATGRPAPALQPYISALALPGPVPVVCFNGACAMRMHPDGQREVVFTEGLTAGATVRVLEVCSQMCLCASYSEPLGATAAPQNADHERQLKRFEALEGITQERAASLEPLLASGRLPLKIVAMTGTPEDTAKQARALLKEDVRVVASEMHVEFLHPAVSKGGALGRLCREALGLGMGDLVAFGDNYNDADMIELAGHGIAMKNAKQAVKDIADQVCQWSNDEEGVAQTLEHLLDSGALAARPSTD